MEKLLCNLKCSKVVTFKSELGYIIKSLYLHKPLRISIVITRTIGACTKIAIVVWTLIGGVRVCGEHFTLLTLQLFKKYLSGHQ